MLYSRPSSVHVALGRSWRRLPAAKPACSSCLSLFLPPLFLLLRIALATIRRRGGGGGGGGGDGAAESKAAGLWHVGGGSSSSSSSGIKATVCCESEQASERQVVSSVASTEARSELARPTDVGLDRLFVRTYGQTANIRISQ